MRMQAVSKAQLQLPAAIPDALKGPIEDEPATHLSSGIKKYVLPPVRGPWQARGCLAGPAMVCGPWQRCRQEAEDAQRLARCMDEHAVGGVSSMCIRIGRILAAVRMQLDANPACEHRGSA
jgi:hypothetical protein